MARITFFLIICCACAFAQAPSEPPATSSSKAETTSASKDVTTVAKKKKSQAVSGDDTYKVKLNDLQGKVNDLKEKIFRTKTRLAILKESILSTSIAGAEALILHRNEMGASFNLEKVIYSLDGDTIYSKIDRDGDLDDQKELPAYNGPIMPGNHTLSVVMIYRGNGFGIFSYFRGYVFTLRSSHTFSAEEGKRIQVKVVGYEKGGITTDLKDRPDIRFENILSEPGRTAPGRPENE
jgi:hypothetical protein